MMTSSLSGNIQGDFEPISQYSDEHGSTKDADGDSPHTENFEVEFHLANETVKSSPRSHSGASSSEVFSSCIPKKHPGYRAKSTKSSSLKSSTSPLRQTSPLSSIPLPVKSSGPIKIQTLIKNVKSSIRTTSTPAGRSSAIASKHTLEIQFINKNKHYLQMRKEIKEKQRPVLDLYLSLVQIKKKLEELGKSVKLENIKLLTYEELTKPSELQGSGETVSMEVVAEMKHSIEEIPRTLIDICKNLLSRRALIVELLESVTKSEVDAFEVSDKIQSLKNEGEQLQHSLDTVINEHQSKINILVGNWQKLLNEKQSLDADNRIGELEGKLEEQQKLTEESNIIIHELHQKMDERKAAYERSITELNGVIHSLKEQVTKLEQGLENEKKTSIEFKTKNNTNAQNVKNMRAKITELENEKTNVEATNAELQKKIKLFQDQLKQKEASWNQEKEELNKNLKHQEHLLQKLTAEKNHFETRFKKIEKEKNFTEETLTSTIEALNTQLKYANNQFDEVKSQRNAVLKKCARFENYIKEMGLECKETMNKLSYSIEWGKAVGEITTPVTDTYIQEIAKDLRIRELQDRISFLEKQQMKWFEQEIAGHDRKQEVADTVMIPMQKQQEEITKYQLLLQESENKLKEKLNDLRSTEIETLYSEIRQLKVRQIALEEQNVKYPVMELHYMIEESRRKLNQLMKRSTESEHTVEKYVDVIEVQTRQINEMENLLRYRENMANVLKASREELVQEKESLIIYSQEIRTLLAKVTRQRKIKDRLTRELQEKLYLREKQIKELKEDIQKLTSDLTEKNRKRFKLQETIGTIEHRLQNEKVKLTEVDFLDECHYDYPISHCNFNNYNSLIPRQERNLHTLKKIGEKLVPNVIKKVKSYNDFSTSEECFDCISNNNLPSTLPYSTNWLKFRSLSMASDTTAEHLLCQHKANSRSFNNLSLQTVDFLKTRLNFLTSVDILLPGSTEINHRSSLERNQVNLVNDSVQTTARKKDSKRNVSKILKMNAK